MVRFVVVISVLVIYSLIILPIYLAILLIGIKNPMLRAKIGQPVIRLGLRLALFFAGTKVSVKGQENIPKEPVLFVGNHRSFFDIPVIYTTMKKQTGFVAKHEVKRVPMLGGWLMALNGLYLKRDDIRQAMQTILSAIDYIKLGSSVCIMPEGTRNHETKMLPFKEGSFKIAEKSGCPIVPIALWKTDEIFEDHFPKIQKAKVTIHYGEPIYINELSKEEKKHVGAFARGQIEKMIEQMQTA